MIDHAEVMVSRLLAQFDGRRVIEAIVRALGEELNECETVLADLQTKRWIDTAEAVQLDGCGVIVDQSRLIDKAIAIPFFGFADQVGATGFNKARFRRRLESHLSSATLGDPEYRKFIKAKVVKNTSKGTTEEVITSFRMIFDASRVIITEMTGGPKIRVGIARKLSETEKTLAQATKLFVKPGGVQIELREHFDPDKTFGFRDQGYQGFGVGRFADQF